jgi:hypothetical protein
MPWQNAIVAINRVEKIPDDLIDGFCSEALVGGS